MLDTLLSAEANNNQINDEGIKEEVNTFTFEGFDTSSTGMTFILLLIATYQDAQQKIYEEIQELYRKMLNSRLGNTFRSLKLSLTIFQN
jgi:cytochrome P450 family 4